MPSKSKLVKRYGGKKRKASAPRANQASNPPLFMDLVEFIGPGFGAFAATRMATRIASTQIAKKWPSMATHAGVAASAGSLLAAWLLAHKVKFLEKYHTPIAVGAGIATLQTAIQMYFPKLGWMVADATPEIAAATAPSAAALPTATSGDDDFEDVTATEQGWHVYNDAHDAGRYERQGQQQGRQQRPQPGRAQAAPAAKPAAAATDNDDLYDIMGEDDDQPANVMGGEN